MMAAAPPVVTIIHDRTRTYVLATPSNGSGFFAQSSVHNGPNSCTKSITDSVYDCLRFCYESRGLCLQWPRILYMLAGPCYKLSKILFSS